MQESTAIKNKIKVVLLLITSLDILFLEPPVNVADQRRRNELIRYVLIPHLHRYVPTLLPVNLGVLRRCNGRRARTWGLPVKFKAKKTGSDFSKIYMKRSSNTRFVHNRMYFSILTKTPDGAADDD